MNVPYWNLRKEPERKYEVRTRQTTSGGRESPHRRRTVYSLWNYYTGSRCSESGKVTVQGVTYCMVVYK